MKVGITSNFTHYIILYFESDWSRIRPLPSTTFSEEQSIPMTALWCPAFSNHGYLYEPL